MHDGLKKVLTNNIQMNNTWSQHLRRAQSNTSVRVHTIYTYRVGTCVGVCERALSFASDVFLHARVNKMDAYI